jgi:hypothetical protein
MQQGWLKYSCVWIVQWQADKIGLNANSEHNGCFTRTR